MFQSSTIHNQRHRAIVDQFDLHVLLKPAGGDGDASNVESFYCVANFYRRKMVVHPSILHAMKNITPDC